MKSDTVLATIHEQPRYMVVGTAGHIDHGKTALVYALTGTDTDRLPEEKQRGITIDLGFAALDLNDGHGGKLHLSLIDVPGHHAFVRNMLAGTGGIDCVMLVIAADEGVKAQTEEHLAICSLLGVPRGLVVLTKVDAITEEHLHETRAQVERFLEHTFLEQAPIVAVSAVRGDGIAELKRSLAEIAVEIPARSSERVPRLPIDRAFSIRGFGTVVTGTLQSGSLHAGETLQQHPAGRLLRVRGLQVHGKNAEAAHAPCRVALNLGGIEVAQIERGDTLTRPQMLSPTSTVDVELSMLENAPALKHGGRVRVHAYTSDTLAKILLFDQKDSVDPGSGLARLRLAKPMLLVPGDRIVLRQCSPAVTVGGGYVLDTTAPPGMRKAKVLDWLKCLKTADEAEKLRLRVARHGVQGMSIGTLVGETGLTADTVRDRVATFVAPGRLIECAGTSGSDVYWISAEALEETVDAVDRVVTESGAVSRAELRSKTGLNVPVFGAVLQRIGTAGKLELAGDSVRIAGRADDIPELKRRRMQAIENIYANAGLAPPLFNDVAKQIGVAPGEMRDLITALLRSKRLVRMGADDVFVHPDALAKLYSDLRQHRGESFDVGRFKTFTGLTRKHAIPLLEYLDQARVTRNSGGTRIVI
jgi:selenocysteine-specific elongation factor